MALGNRGFTYIAALCLAAILAVMSLTAVERWQMAAQREREQELLFVGEQYRSAITQYYQEYPGSGAPCLTDLSQLLLDRNLVSTMRPLRRLYLDPITQSATWGLTTTKVSSGGNTSNLIVGVYSLSSAVPIKQQGFSDVESDFANAKSYQDWKFTYQAASTLTSCNLSSSS